MKQDTFQIGEYAISTLATTDYVTLIDVPTLITSKYGVLKSDTVTYVADGEAIPDISGVSSEIVPAILLSRNGEFSETITVGRSNAVYASYGSGNKPKIYGSELITGWTLHSGNIWKATFATTINQLFLNGIRATAARYPNDTWLTVTSASQSAVISSDIAVQAANYYQNANVLIQLREFRMNTRSVTASSESSGTTTLTLSSNLDYATLTTDRFYLTNKLEFLDTPGEWYYDDATNTVYLWKPDGTEPTDTEVRGSTLDYGIVVNDKDYITIKNLEIAHQNEAAIDAYYITNSNLIIDNNTINGTDRYGIYIRGTENVISNNTINGVNVVPIYAYSHGIIINDNTITNTGVVSNISPRGWYGQKNVALYASGQAATIQHNIIDTASYIGIEWEGQNTVVDKNYITNTSQLMTDGGAIYTYELSAETQEVLGSVVSNNIIKNHNGPGLYMDNNVEGVTLLNNTVINTKGENGFFANTGTKDIVLENNTFYNTDGIRGAMASSSGLIVQYNTVLNDIDAEYEFFAPLLATATITTLPSSVSLWDNNTYIDRVHDVARLFQTVTDGNRTFSTWKTDTGLDSLTIFNPALNANETEKLFYNETKIVKTYYLNVAANVKNSITNADITTSFTLQPFTSIILRGLDLNYISETQYETVAPVMAAFTVKETLSIIESYNGEVEILSFTASGNPTKYLITESATVPSRSLAWTDTIPTIYHTTSSGAITLYGWCMDEYGNISASLSDNTTIRAIGTIGNTTAYGIISNLPNTMRANTFTMPEDGYLVSMVFYHSTSTAAITLGVYSNSSTSPDALIASTASTEINNETGWQEVALTEPLFVASGTVIWLAYNKSTVDGNMYVNTTTGLPRAYKTQTYTTEALTDPFGTPTLDTGGSYSIYAKYVK